VRPVKVAYFHADGRTDVKHSSLALLFSNGAKSCVRKRNV